MTIYTFLQVMRPDPTPRQIASAANRLRRHDGTILLSDLAGDAWAGFYIGADDTFCNPMWKRGFTADELKAQFWQLQQLASALHTARRCQTELDVARAALDKAEELAAWYRRQLILESRAGLMLAHIVEPDHA